MDRSAIVESQVPSDPPVSALFVSNSASLGGAPRVLLDMVTLISRSRLQPTMFLGEDGPIRQRFEAIAPTFTSPRVPLSVVHSSTARAVLAWTDAMVGAASLRSIVHRLRPRVIYHNTVGGQHLHRFVSGFPAARIMHVHGLYIEHLCRGDRLMDWVAGFADRYVCCSHADARTLRECVGVDDERIVTIHAGINVAAVEAARPSDPAGSRRRLGIPQDRVVIGGVGGAHVNKGLDLFVAMAGQLQSQWPGPTKPYFVWLGGEPPDHHRYATAVRKRVRALGLAQDFRLVAHTPTPHEVMALFDVFVLSSRQEALPLVVMEAMALGVPVVAFDEGGVPEMLGGGVGVLVSPLTSEALCEGVLSMSVEGARLALVEAAAGVVRDRFDIRCNVARLEDLILDAVDSVPVGGRSHSQRGSPT